MIIRAEHVTRRFGSLLAINDISFEVAAGEIFAFLGPNGAGKTTMIRMLTTLLAVTNGRLTIDCLDPMRQSSEVRRRFGIVFQDPSIDQDLSAAENMELHGALYGMPRKLRRARTHALLRTFELWDRKDKPVEEFSGGMRRRLEIARALLHVPKILFLDEPTLGLDPHSRNQLWAHVRHVNRNEGVTVFLTTHHMDEAERTASRVAIVDHGELVASGTSQQLKQLAGADSLEDAFLMLTKSPRSDQHLNSGSLTHLPA